MFKVEFFDGDKWIFAAQFHNEENAWNFVKDSRSMFRVADKQGNILKAPPIPEGKEDEIDKRISESSLKKEWEGEEAGLWEGVLSDMRTIENRTDFIETMQSRYHITLK
jgi:hypothetical protein